MRSALRLLKQQETNNEIFARRLESGESPLSAY
ncbi:MULTISPECIES: hypothetical protein [Photorhabdus]